jgi:hypothetical protein
VEAAAVDEPILVMMKGKALLLGLTLTTMTVTSSRRDAL